MSSFAHDKLKKEEPKAEWRVFVLPNKSGLKIVHFDEIRTLSKMELEDIMRGYLLTEYYPEIIVDMKTGHRIHVMQIIDLSRYTWLPKYMYRRFLKSTCEVLEIPYKVEMLEAVTSKPLSPKAVVVFPEKSVFEKAEKRTAEIKVREDAMKREIDNIREMMKAIKEEKK